MSPSPWWEEPLRILDYVFMAQMDTIDLRGYVALCRRLHCNTVHFHVADNANGGLDEDSFYFACRHAQRTNRDLLAEFLPLAREAGIRVVAYANNHWFPKTFGAKHPDWWVVTPEGARIENLYGDDDLTFCVNTPWRRWSYDIFEDLCAYPLDGIFFDGPLTYLGSHGCWCDSCRALFERRHGREMPAWDQGDPESWRLLVDFAQWSLQEYYREAYELIKARRPGAAVYANLCMEFEPGWFRGRQSRPLMPWQDLLASEGGFHYSRVLRRRNHTALSSKLYPAQAGGKPAVCAVSPALGPWRLHTLSAPEIRVLLTEASTGVNPYFAVYLEAQDTPGIAAGAEVLGFLERQEPHYRGSRSRANVALLYGSQTVDFYRGGAEVPCIDISGVAAQTTTEITSFSRSFEAYFELLMRSRVPFDILDEQGIAAGALSRYGLLVLPNCACFSEAQCALLREYVAQGGRLIAEFETSHYDEDGRRREGLGLGEVFGVASTGEIQGPRRWDYGHVMDPGSAYLRDLEQPEMPAPSHNLRVSVAGGRVLVALGEARVSNIVSDYPVSGEPMLVVNDYGEGRCFYFSGLFGDRYREHELVPYLTVLRAILREEVASPLVVEGVPHLLHVSLRENTEGNLLVHLVNYEIGPVEKAVPAYDLRAQVRTDRLVTSVRALRREEELSFTPTPDGVAFTLPLLEEYEVVLVEHASR